MTGPAFSNRILRATLGGILLSAAPLACVDNKQTEPANFEGTLTEETHAPLFVDATEQSRLEFTHLTFPSSERLLPEIVGAGVALIDYDSDGDLDVYFVQGGHTPDGPVQNHNGNRLYRNDLSRDDGQPSGQLVFTDVSDLSGVNHTGYGMGVACADFDNDGDTDLYVTNVGSNVLYRNNGDGRFEDITQTAGVDDPRWSASASFADFDNDGLLDLFVTNYVADAVSGNRPCDNLTGQRDYCSPTVYHGTSDSLFRNLGNGKFEDVSTTSGIASAKAAGLGVIAADFDQDSKVDFFVANDQSANFLWHNLGDGRFEESGLISGSAYNGHGMAEASMGVSAADFDGDGDEDLFMTHLNTQTNTLYVNNGKGQFVDATDKARLDTASLMFTGFGSNWFDADNDGDYDLFVANGAVIMEATQIKHSDFPYAQRNQLFINNGKGRYSEWRDEPGSALEALGVSRGSAVGDIDNDGDLDLLVTNGNGRAQLLLNMHENSAHWLGLVLQGKHSNRDGTGARIAMLRENKAPLWRRAHSDGSFLSANDRRVHVGLDNKEDSLTTDAITIGIVWPHGQREQWHDVPRGRYTELVEGSGEPWPTKMENK